MLAKLLRAVGAGRAARQHPARAGCSGLLKTAKAATAPRLYTDDELRALRPRILTVRKAAITRAFWQAPDRSRFSIHGVASPSRRKGCRLTNEAFHALELEPKLVRFQAAKAAKGYTFGAREYHRADDLVPLTPKAEYDAVLEVNAFKRTLMAAHP